MSYQLIQFYWTNNDLPSNWRQRKESKYIKIQYLNSQYTVDEKDYLLCLPDNLSIDTFNDHVTNHDISNQRLVTRILKKYKQPKMNNKTNSVWSIDIGEDLSLHSLTQNKCASDSFNRAGGKLVPCYMDVTKQIDQIYQWSHE